MSETTEELMPTDDFLVGEITRRGSSSVHWEGAARAFENLYHRHADQLLLFLSPRLPESEVHEVHQAVWMQVWRLGSAAANDENFRARLLRIAGEEIAGRSDAESNDDSEIQSGLTLDNDGEAGAAIIDQQRMQIMRECFNRLESDVANVVRRRLAGENYEAICFDLGVESSVALEMFERGKALLSVYLKRTAARST